MYFDSCIYSCIHVLIHALMHVFIQFVGLVDYMTLSGSADQLALDLAKEIAQVSSLVCLVPSSCPVLADCIHVILVLDFHIRV